MECFGCRNEDIKVNIFSTLWKLRRREIMYFKTLLFQRSPTECGGSENDSEASVRRGHDSKTVRNFTGKRIMFSTNKLCGH